MFLKKSIRVLQFVGLTIYYPTSGGVFFCSGNTNPESVSDGSRFMSIIIGKLVEFDLSLSILIFNHYILALLKKLFLNLSPLGIYLHIADVFHIMLGSHYLHTYILMYV